MNTKRVFAVLDGPLAGQVLSMSERKQAQEQANLGYRVIEYARVGRVAKETK